MFNGYNDASLIFNEFNQEAEKKKQENTAKWSYSPSITSTGVPAPAHNRQTEYWQTKPNIIGLGGPIHTATKCNCSECYATGNTGYQGDSTRNASWLPRRLSVPVNGSSESCKLPGPHQWNNLGLANPGSCLIDGNMLATQHTQDGGEKLSYYRPYQNAVLPEFHQPGVITSVKSVPPPDGHVLIKDKDEVSSNSTVQDMTYYGQSSTRQPVFCNPPYNCTRNLEKRLDNRSCDVNDKYSNVNSYRHSGSASSYPIDPLITRPPVTEPYAKAVPLTLNQNSVPSTNHRNLKENIPKPCIEQSLMRSTNGLPRKITGSEVYGVHSEKNERLVYQQTMVKDGIMTENFRSEPLHGLTPTMAMEVKNNQLLVDYSHLSMNRDLSKHYENSTEAEGQKKFLLDRDRQVDYFAHNNLNNSIKRNSQTSIQETKKDCFLNQINSSDEYGSFNRLNPISNVPKYLEVGGQKGSVSVFYSKDSNTDKVLKPDKCERLQENPSMIQRTPQNLLKNENLNVHARLTRPPLIFNDPSDFRFVDRVQNSFPYPSNSMACRGFVRPQYSCQQYNVTNRFEYPHPFGVNSFPRNDINHFNHRNLPSRAPNCGPIEQTFIPSGSSAFVLNPLYCQPHGNLEKTLSSPPVYTGLESLPPSTTSVYSQVIQNRLENSRIDSTLELKKTNQFETIKNQPPNKNECSKISPLRLLRKKKVNNPKNESVNKSPVPTNPSETAPALDVRKFWSTWADEEEENGGATASPTTATTATTVGAPPQMVVLDCQNINPEQAELLQLYENNLNFENGSTVSLKTSECGKVQNDITNCFEAVVKNVSAGCETLSPINEMKSTDFEISKIVSENRGNHYTNNERSDKMQEENIQFSSNNTYMGLTNGKVLTVPLAISQSTLHVMEKSVGNNKASIPLQNDDNRSNEKIDFLKMAGLNKDGDASENDEDMKIKFNARRFSFMQDIISPKLKTSEDAHSENTKENVSAFETSDKVSGKVSGEGELKKDMKESNDELPFDRLSPFHEESLSNSPYSEKCDFPNLPTSEYRRNKFLDYSNGKFMINGAISDSSDTAKVLKINTKHVDLSVEIDENAKTKKSDDLNMAKDIMLSEESIKRECPPKNSDALLDKHMCDEFGKSAVQRFDRESVINDSKPKDEKKTGLQGFEMDNILQKLSKINFCGPDVKVENVTNKVDIEIDSERVQMIKAEENKSKKNKKDKNNSFPKSPIQFSIRKSHNLKLSLHLVNNNNNTNTNKSNSEGGNNAKKSKLNNDDTKEDWFEKGFESDVKSLGSEQEYLISSLSSTEVELKNYRKHKNRKKKRKKNDSSPVRDNVIKSKIRENSTGKGNEHGDDLVEENNSQNDKSSPTKVVNYEASDYLFDSGFPEAQNFPQKMEESKSPGKENETLKWPNEDLKSKSQDLDEVKNHLTFEDHSESGNGCEKMKISWDEMNKSTDSFAVDKGNKLEPKFKEKSMLVGGFLDSTPEKTFNLIVSENEELVNGFKNAGIVSDRGDCSSASQFDSALPSNKDVEVQKNKANSPEKCTDENQENTQVIKNDFDVSKHLANGIFDESKSVKLHGTNTDLRGNQNASELIPGKFENRKEINGECYKFSLLTDPDSSRKNVEKKTLSVLVSQELNLRDSHNTVSTCELERCSLNRDHSSESSCHLKQFDNEKEADVQQLPTSTVPEIKNSSSSQLEKSQCYADEPIVKECNDSDLSLVLRFKSDEKIHDLQLPKVDNIPEYEAEKNKDFVNSKVMDSSSASTLSDGFNIDCDNLKKGTGFNVEEKDFLNGKETETPVKHMCNAKIAKDQIRTPNAVFNASERFSLSEEIECNEISEKIWLPSTNEHNPTEESDSETYVFFNTLNNKNKNNLKLSKIEPDKDEDSTAVEDKAKFYEISEALEAIFQENEMHSGSINAFDSSQPSKEVDFTINNLKTFNPNPLNQRNTANVAEKLENLPKTILSKPQDCDSEFSSLKKIKEQDEIISPCDPVISTSNDSKKAEDLFMEGNGKNVPHFPCNQKEEILLCEKVVERNNEVIEGNIEDTDEPSEVTTILDTETEIHVEEMKKEKEKTFNDTTKCNGYITLEDKHKKRMQKIYEVKMEGIHKNGDVELGKEIEQKNEIVVKCSENLNCKISEEEYEKDENRNKEKIRNFKLPRVCEKTDKLDKEVNEIEMQNGRKETGTKLEGTGIEIESNEKASGRNSAGAINEGNKKMKNDNKRENAKGRNECEIDSELQEDKKSSLFNHKGQCQESSLPINTGNENVQSLNEFKHSTCSNGKRDKEKTGCNEPMHNVKMNETNEKNNKIITNEKLLTCKKGQVKTRFSSKFFFDQTMKIQRRHSLGSGNIVDAKLSKGNKMDERRLTKTASKIKFTFSEWKSRYQKAKSCPPIACETKSISQMKVPILDVPVRDIPLPPGNPPLENCFDLITYLRKRKLSSEGESEKERLVRSNKMHILVCDDTSQVIKSPEKDSNSNSFRMKKEFQNEKSSIYPYSVDQTTSLVAREQTELSPEKKPVENVTTKSSNERCLLSETVEPNKSEASKSPIGAATSNALSVPPFASGSENCIENNNNTQVSETVEMENMEVLMENVTNNCNIENEKNGLIPANTQLLNESDVPDEIEKRLKEICENDLNLELKNVLIDQDDQKSNFVQNLNFKSKNDSLVLVTPKVLSIEDIHAEVLGESACVDMNFEGSDGSNSEKVELPDGESTGETGFENDTLMKDGFYECEDIPTSEDLPNGNTEVEKVSDDVKFRHMMQNCLDNAKKFLNVSNLKLFSCSMEDLLELDCQFTDDSPDDKKFEKPNDDSGNHISRDVLLGSCEDLISDDLEFSQKCPPADLSMDFVPSFVNENASNGCSEVLPVDNWPYLEEEVASSPVKVAAEETVVTPFLENLSHCEYSGSNYSKNISKIDKHSNHHKSVAKGSSKGESIRTRKNLEWDDEFLPTNKPKITGSRRKTMDGFHEGNVLYRETLDKNGNNFKMEITKLKNGLEKIEHLWQNHQNKYESEVKPLVNENCDSRFDSSKKKENPLQKRTPELKFTSSGEKIKFKAARSVDLTEKPPNGKRRNRPDYNSPKWQPRVLLFRISKKQIRRIQEQNRSRLRLLKTDKKSRHHKFNENFIDVREKNSHEITKSGASRDSTIIPAAKKTKVLTSGEKFTSNREKHCEESSSWAKKPIDGSKGEKSGLNKKEGKIYKEQNFSERPFNTGSRENSLTEYKGQDTNRSSSSQQKDSRNEFAGISIKKSKSGHLFERKRSKSFTYSMKDLELRDQEKPREKQTYQEAENLLSQILESFEKPSESILKWRKTKSKGVEMKSLKPSKVDQRVSNFIPEKKKEGGEKLLHDDQRRRRRHETLAPSFFSWEKNCQGNNSTVSKSQYHSETITTKENDDLAKRRQSVDFRPGRQDEKTSKVDKGKSNERKRSESKDKIELSRERKSEHKAKEKQVPELKETRELLKFAEDDLNESIDQADRKEATTEESGDECSNKPWTCEVCGFNDSTERMGHIKGHPFHCQSCHLAFRTETRFINHLTKKHKDIRNQHHCLLCELSFDTEKQYQRHLETREHIHLETVEKNTINTLFTLLTGQPCPVLGLVELRPEWLPNQAGTVHFYHQATPLSLALQYLKMHHDLSSYSKDSSSHPT